MNYFHRTPRRCPNETRSGAGFSLVEALVATAIFALIMIGTLPMFFKSMGDTVRNRNRFHFNGEITSRK